MKSLVSYLECEGGGGAMPSNTLGAGNPGLVGPSTLSEPLTQGQIEQTPTAKTKKEKKSTSKTMKDLKEYLNEYLNESEVTEFKYATSGEHNFIDEIVKFLESKGYTKTENKTLRPEQYRIAENGYELFARSKKDKMTDSTTLVCVRKGDNGKYDYYFQKSINPHWKETIEFPWHYIRFRSHQYRYDGYFDTNDNKIHDRFLQSLRSVLQINK